MGIVRDLDSEAENWVGREFGRYLVDWRLENEIPICQAAKRIRMPKSRLAELEGGCPVLGVTEREIQRISDAYDISARLIRQIASGKQVQLGWDQKTKGEW